MQVFQLKNGLIKRSFGKCLTNFWRTFWNTTEVHLSMMTSCFFSRSCLIAIDSRNGAVIA
jgi:hypothetical protein